MKVKLEEVKALEPYKIWVRFADGVEGVLDYSDFAGKGVFKAWNDLNFFNGVYIRSSDNVVCWSDDLDFDKENMYMQLTGLTWDQLKNKPD